jgi:hypothetical protein
MVALASLPVRGDNETSMPFHGLRCARGAFVIRVLNWFAPGSNKKDTVDSPRYWTIGLFIFSVWVFLIWVVWSGNRSKVLGSDYVAKERPEPVHSYGKVLYTWEEFAELWKTSKQRLVVFVDSGAVNRFERLIGARPRILLQFGDTVLVENIGADRESGNDKSP